MYTDKVETIIIKDDVALNANKNELNNMLNDGWRIYDHIKLDDGIMFFLVLGEA